MNDRLGDRSYGWMFAVLVISAPLVVILCATLWRMPYPLSEAVALFEDVARQPPSKFLSPDTSYYRPLFHLTLSALWHGMPTLESFLQSIRLLHIVPVTLLILLFVWHVRPRTFIDAAAATAAITVLVGSPGFFDNLELPLSYTIVGMPIALLVWMLLERQHAPWRLPVVVALTLVAIGFKEQGLVIVPLVVAAWWTGAPGASRTTAMTLIGVSIVYVAFRFSRNGTWPLFEQELGYGFGTISTSEATTRFGAFPLWMYSYNGVSTIANTLFAEPTAGVFRIVRDIRRGLTESWEIVSLCSSVGLTSLVVWWGIGSLKRDGTRRWSPESRIFLATIVALIACGVLSFNYSRSRLGGMAVVFYAIAAFFSFRAAATWAMTASRARCATAGVALLVLATAWQIRAITTIEHVRKAAVNNSREWLVNVQQRRIEFADRPVYLNIMERMIDQGTTPHGIQRTKYPGWLAEMVGDQ